MYIEECNNNNGGANPYESIPFMKFNPQGMGSSMSGAVSPSQGMVDSMVRDSLSAQHPSYPRGV